MEQRKQMVKPGAIARVKRRAERAAAQYAAWLEAAMPAIAQSVVAVDLAEQRQKRERRKRRTKHLIRLGGLISRIGLLDLDHDVLLGALSSASRYVDEKKWTDRWRKLGDQILAEPAYGQNALQVKMPELATAEDIRLARKYATRRLIVAGGIIEKAGLGQCEREVLAGILAELSKYGSDERRVDRWRAAGAALPVDRHTEVEVSFPDPVSRATGLALRRLGLKFDRRNLVWLGLADPTSVARTAKAEGGMVRVDPKNGRKRRKPRRRKNFRETGSRPTQARKRKK